MLRRKSQFPDYEPHAAALETEVDKHIGIALRSISIMLLHGKFSTSVFHICCLTLTQDSRDGPLSLAPPSLLLLHAHPLTSMPFEHKPKQKEKHDLQDLFQASN
jgi:hypothetical protein